MDGGQGIRPLDGAEQGTGGVKMLKIWFAPGRRLSRRQILGRLSFKFLLQQSPSNAIHYSRIKSRVR